MALETQWREPEALVLIDKHWGTRNVKHAGLSVQRKRYMTYFLPTRFGMDVVNSLVTSALSVWPGHTWLLHTLMCISVILSIPLS